MGYKVGKRGRKWGVVGMNEGGGGCGRGGGSISHFLFPFFKNDFPFRFLKSEYGISKQKV